MNRRRSLLALLVFPLGGCGGSGAPAAPQDVRSSAEADAPPSLVPPPPSASAAPVRTNPEPSVVMGRISDRESGSGVCNKDDDCVVVTRLRREQLCPPGIAVSRELAENEERWRQLGVAYKPPRDPCPELDLVARGGCSSGICNTVRSPGSESPTLSEQIVGARLPEIERCFAEATQDAPPPAAGVTAVLAVMQSGDVAAVHFGGGHSWPAFQRCVQGVLIRLTFPQPRTVRVVSVPFTFR